MAASKDTVYQVAKILIEEVGVPKARRIAERLWRETTGNTSYLNTVRALEVQMVKISRGGVEGK